MARCGVRWFEFVSWAVRAPVSMPTATCRSSRTVVASASACSPESRPTIDIPPAPVDGRPDSITRTGWSVIDLATTDAARVLDYLRRAGSTRLPAPLSDRRTLNPNRSAKVLKTALAKASLHNATTLTAAL